MPRGESISAINASMSGAESVARNIANQKVVGGFQQHVRQRESFYGQKNKMSSSVSSEVFIDYSSAGNVESTGIKTHISVNGVDKIPVLLEDGVTIAMTRSGRFTVTSDGYFINDNGHKLLYCPDSKKASSLTDLVPLRKQENFLQAKATENVSLLGSINKDTSVLYNEKTGVKFQVWSDVNPVRSKSLLPDYLGNKMLRHNATTYIQSEGGKVERKLVYFKPCISNKATAQQPIWGARDATTNMSIKKQADAANTDLIQGQSGIKIIVDNVSSDFYCGYETGQFKSLATLAECINNSSLRSDIFAEIRDDKLVISHRRDAHKKISFENTGNSRDVVASLGLSGHESVQDHNQYGTLDNLVDAINYQNDQVSGLKATRTKDKKGIDSNILQINTTKATEGLSTVKFEDLGVNPIEFVELRPTTDATKNLFDKARDKIISQAKCHITAPMHGLKKGDWVRINKEIVIPGAGADNAKLPAGVYYVSEVTDNGFCVNGIVNAPTDHMVLGAENQKIRASAETTWQRVHGETGEQKTGQVVQATSGGNIKISIAAHGCAENDIVYVDGFYGNLNLQDVGDPTTVGPAGQKQINMPAGYYKVVAVNGNPIGGVDNIVLTPHSVAAAVRPDQLDGGSNSTLINFTKIGSVNGDIGHANNNGTINTKVMVTVNTSDIVQYNIGTNHSYSAGDKIRFKGLPDPLPGALAGTMTNDVDYEVTEVNKAEGWIKFRAGSPATGASDFLYSQLKDLHVDNGNLLAAYYGYDPKKTSVEAAYSPTNATRNLSASLVGAANFDPNQITLSNIDVLDAKGGKHNLVLQIARLSKDEFAVEIAARKNDKGEYELSNILDQATGLLKHGILTIDPYGRVTTKKGFEDKLLLVPTDNAATVSIDLDFNEMVFTSAISNLIAKQDGRDSGEIMDYDLSNGEVVQVLKNGGRQKVGDVYLARGEVDTGDPRGGGTFVPNSKTGSIYVGKANQSGFGAVQAGAITTTTSNSTEQIIELSDYTEHLTLTISAEAKLQGVNRDAIDRLGSAR